MSSGVKEANLTTLDLLETVSMFKREALVCSRYNLRIETSLNKK